MSDDTEISWLVSDLNHAANAYAVIEETERERGDAIAATFARHLWRRFLRHAANLQRLQRLTGDIPMGQVADTIHKLNQQLIQANADRDAAKADAAKSQSDVDRLNSLTAAGRVLDDADVAALAEVNAASDASPGATYPANGPQTLQDATSGTAGTVTPPTPSDAPTVAGTPAAPAPDQPTA